MSTFQVILIWASLNGYKNIEPVYYPHIHASTCTKYSICISFRMTGNRYTNEWKVDMFACSPPIRSCVRVLYGNRLYYQWSLSFPLCFQWRQNGIAFVFVVFIHVNEMKTLTQNDFWIRWCDCVYVMYAHKRKKKKYLVARNI